MPAATPAAASSRTGSRPDRRAGPRRPSGSICAARTRGGDCRTISRSSGRRAASSSSRASPPGPSVGRPTTTRRWSRSRSRARRATVVRPAQRDHRDAPGAVGGRHRLELAAAAHAGVRRAPRDRLPEQPGQDVGRRGLRAGARVEPAGEQRAVPLGVERQVGRLARGVGRHRRPRSRRDVEHRLGRAVGTLGGAGEPERELAALVEHGEDRRRAVGVGGLGPRVGLRERPEGEDRPPLLRPAAACARAGATPAAARASTSTSATALAAAERRTTATILIEAPTPCPTATSSSTPS